MKGVLGMFDRKEVRPKLPQEDSGIKKSMKAVSKLAHANRPKMPQVEKA
jgi:hypothetical protein